MLPMEALILTLSQINKHILTMQGFQIDKSSRRKLYSSQRTISSQ